MLSLPTTVHLSLPVIAQDAIIDLPEHSPREFTSAQKWIPLSGSRQKERRNIQSHEFIFDPPKAGRCKRAGHALLALAESSNSGDRSAESIEGDIDESWNAFVVLQGINGERREGRNRGSGRRRRGVGQIDNDEPKVDRLIESRGDQRSSDDARDLFSTAIPQINGAQATGVNDASGASSATAASPGVDVSGGSGAEGAMMVEVIPSVSQFQTSVLGGERPFKC